MQRTRSITNTLILAGLLAVGFASSPKTARAAEPGLEDLVSSSFDCFEPTAGVCIKIVCTVSGCSPTPAIDLQYYVPSVFIEVIRGPGDILLNQGGTPGGVILGSALDYQQAGDEVNYGHTWEVRVWDIKNLSEQLLEQIGACLGCEALPGTIEISIGSDGVDVSGFDVPTLPSDFFDGLLSQGGRIGEILEESGILEEGSDFMNTASSIYGDGMDIMGKVEGAYSATQGGVADKIDHITDEYGDELDQVGEGVAEEVGIESAPDCEEGERGCSKPGTAELAGDVANTALSGCGAPGVVKDLIEKVSEATEEASMGTVKLAYSTELDILHWRTGCRDLLNSVQSLRCIGSNLASAVSGGKITGGEYCIDHWGPLYPRQIANYGGAVTSAGLAAYRAMHMASDLGLLDYEISKSGKMQAAYPEVSGCFEPGEPDENELADMTGYDRSLTANPQRLGFIWWTESSCCTLPTDQAKCAMSFSGT